MCKEDLLWLIKYLKNENDEYKNLKIPKDEEGRFYLYRALVNIREPKEISSEYLKREDKLLKEVADNKGIVSIDNIENISKNLYLYKGDITLLECDGIVNAANSEMLGCFYPNHKCIDNAIHTFAGVRLRLKCSEIMNEQCHPESTGKAKITPAYNLPSKYILHTVGPIVRGDLTKRNISDLRSCYSECLILAKKYKLESIAFPCISTGEFCFPNKEAAKIALYVICKFLKDNDMKIIINVFKEADYQIYKDLAKKKY
ncbi:protein-ADP-ribose hydrolase [Anaerofustis stercorihominis]|uniref:protein-ADP-ribose hydrolase n=1 Tax=Anaerofustis stercorihominis TaxID=214853 RepID=UPI00214B5DF2|nr:protein-ADP-ribose hydrolase [Anaerofustis stercorihominis]MCR2032212.1 protein-ADP-ribose hydrolase [Anaerofustis stercorihominis]